MLSQTDKNKKLLSELSSLGQVKRKYESSRTALILCVLLAAIGNYFFTLEWWMHLISIVVTAFSAYVCYQAHGTLQKVNLREKYSIGKRASDEYTPTPGATDQLYTKPAANTGSVAGTSRSSTKGKITTKSPIGPSTASLRNRLNAAPGRSPDYQQQLERENYDPDAPSRLLSIDKKQDSLRQSSMFDNNAASRPASAYTPGGYGGYAPNTPSESPSHRQYHLSPLTTGPSLKSSADTFRSVDALQALQLRQISDDWVEHLREILGRDLCKIIKLFDESVHELLSALRRANVPAETLEKAENALEFRQDGKEVAVGGVTIEEIVKFAQQVGVSVDTLQKFDQTSNFMKLCQWLIEMRQTAAGSSFFPTAVMTSSFLSPPNPAANKKRLTPMIDRLRDMARESRDVGLNIHWINMDMNEILMTGRIEHEICDQEVALALFLNRCDSFAHLRTTGGAGMFGMSEKFSKSHYAVGLMDLRHRLRPYYNNSVNNASDIASAQSKHMPVVLLQRTAQDADLMKESSSAKVSSVGTNTAFSNKMKPPHFDVIRITSHGQYYEELFSIDTSRQDVFESLIVFMLTIYLTSHDGNNYNEDGEDEEDDDGEEGNKQMLADFAGTFDYRVIKPLLEEIISKEELQEMVNEVSLPAAFASSSSSAAASMLALTAGVFGSSGKTASPTPRHPISPNFTHSRLFSASSNSQLHSAEGKGSSNKFDFSSSSSSSLPSHHRTAGTGNAWSSAKKIPLHSSMFGSSSSSSSSGALAGATPSSGAKSAYRSTASSSTLDQSYHQGHMSRFYSSVGSPQ